MFDEANSSPLDDPGARVLAQQPPPAPQTPTPSQFVPKREEPFISSRADRPYHQWGQPDFALQGAMNYPGFYRGPLMPQMNDFAQLIHSAVMGLGRFGSRYTGMPAIAMGTYASAYWNAYQKGMHERAGQAYQQYRQARQMTIDRGKEEMLEYAKIYATYFKDGKITDTDGFSHDLLQAAEKYQNQALINQIQSGNIGAAERILQMTDSHIMNLIKAQHQEERNKLLDEERRLRIKKMKEGDELPPDWGGSGSGDGSGQSKSVPDTTDDTEDGDTEDGDTESKTDDESPTRTAELGTSDVSPSVPRALSQEAPRREAQTSPSTPHVATPEEVNRRIDDIARGELRGEAVDKGVPKQILPRIAARKADLERQLNDIARSGATGQDMLNKIRAFDPSIADTLEDMISGVRAVQPGGISGGQQAIWNRLTSLARTIRPGWGPEVYSFRQKFSDPNGKSQQTLVRSASMVGAAKKVLEALKDIGEDEKPPENWVDQFLSRHFTGDNKWSKLGVALNSYVEESTVVARGTSGAEGDINRVLKEYAPMIMGPKSIRGLIETEAGVAVSKIQSEVDSWKSMTGDKNPPLTFNPDAMAHLQALDHLDTMTGEIKGVPVPDDLKPLIGLSKTRSEPNLSDKAPRLPASAPSGSKIMYDKNTGKPWVVYPDKSVHPMEP